MIKLLSSSVETLIHAATFQFLATARHVVEKADSYEIVTPDGQRYALQHAKTAFTPLTTSSAIAISSLREAQSPPADRALAGVGCS